MRRPEERDLGRHPREALPRLADVGEGVLEQGEVVAAVAPHIAVHGEEMVAFDVGREHADAELPCEREDAVLREADPLAAQLDHRAVTERVIQEAPADAVAGLQHEDREPGGQKVARGGQPGEPGTHNDWVHPVGGPRMLRLGHEHGVPPSVSWDGRKETPPPRRE
jgi:hypothetical protein